MENHPKLTRRDFLRGAALAGVGATIAACAPAAPPAPAPAAAKAEPTKAAAGSSSHRGACSGPRGQDPLHLEPR